MIARVDDLCGEGRTQIEGFETPRSLSQSAAFLSEVLPVIKQNLRRVRAVGPIPAQDRAIYLEWLQARTAIVQTTEKMLAAAADKDLALFQRFAAEQGELDNRADAAARKYGFEVCGRSAPVPGSPEPAGS